MRGDYGYRGREGVTLVGARRHRRRSPSPCDMRPARIRQSLSPGCSLSPFSGEDDGFGLDHRGGARRVRRRRRRRGVGDEDGFEFRPRRRMRVCENFGDSRSPSPPRDFRRGSRAPPGRGRDYSPAQASADSRDAPRLRGGRRRVAQDAYDTSTTGVNAIPLGVPRAPSRERTPSVVNDEEVCLDFRRGKCRFGETCRYSHGDGKVEAAKFEVCMDFKRGRCRFMENCKFSHGEADIEAAKNKKTHRVWVMHTDCAKVIGKGGRAMREVEEKTRTLLKVQPERDMESVGAAKERYVDIIGTKENCLAAVQLILEQTRYLRDDEDGKVLKDTRGSDDGLEELPMVIEVKPEDVGRVIGRKGDMIKEIEQKSNAKVEVDKVTGKLEIFGKTEAQSQALELVLAEVTFAKDDSGTIIKEDTKKKDGEDVAKLPPMVIWIKDEHAGRVIGKGGETIHDMMKKSNTDIKVQKNEDVPGAEPGAPKEREIRIFGTKENQDQALALLMNEVCWCRNSEGVLKDVPDERQERKRKKEEERAAREAKAEAEASKSKRRGGGSSGLWVCATCGGDHKTKECPYTIGMGMQLGMQMSMQAMGMALPPGMPPIPGMPPMMPGMNPMMALPGMPGMLPGGTARGSQAPGSEYEYSYCSESEDDAGAVAFPASGGPDRPRPPGDVVRPSSAPGLAAVDISRSRQAQSARQPEKRPRKMRAEHNTAMG